MLSGTGNEEAEEDSRTVLDYALTDDKDLEVIDKIINCLLKLKLITPIRTPQINFFYFLSF
jgi:hypothetical protein